MPSPTTRLPQLLHELSHHLGTPLQTIEGSITTEGAYGVLTAIARPTEPATILVPRAALLKLFITDEHEWALVFHYLANHRVAPTGQHHIRLTRDATHGTWKSAGWEPDTYDEWTTLETWPHADDLPPTPPATP